MPAIDFIVEPRWLIPVEPHGVVLEDHAIVISAGQILTILPAQEARSSYPDADWHSRPNHALLPGFINTHTHAPMSLLRGCADDLPLDIWLTDHIWPLEGRWVDREFVRDATDLAILEMLRGGTTCFQDMYMFPDEVAAVAAERGIRACVSMIVIEAPTAWANNADEYIDRGLTVHDTYRDHPLIDTSFGPHATYTVSESSMKRILTLANQLEVPVQMHIHETAAEVQQSVDNYGVRPLARLHEQLALTPLLNAVHMTQLNDDEIALLAETGVSVVHCPESNMKLASGTCPVTELLDAGINVALGTDGAASNNDLDMLGELRTAALVAKQHSSDARSVPAADALKMATLNGARALGIDAKTGSLLKGKAADMICINLDTPSCLPVHNVLSTLVYSASRDQVTDVWVAGKPVYEDGHFNNCDPDDIMQRARNWGQRITGASQ
jgi:5-methylthioadenosine/S-adenosylhomocysteine deaminase